MSATTFRLPMDSAFATDSAIGGAVSHPWTAAHDIALYFVRTEAGETELRRPHLELSAPARALLFAIEETMAIDLCIEAALASSLADAMQLLARGLIRVDSFDANCSVQAQKIQLQRVVGAILELPAEELYTLLTRHAKLRLGLLQGFRMVLALERCTSHHEQRALAIRFVEEVWRAQGERGIAPLRASLRG